MHLPHGIARTLAVLGVALLFSQPVAAQTAPYTTSKDIEVAVRVLGFVYGMPKGPIDIGIVYDPGNAASSSEATELRSIIDKTGVFASRTLHARLVPISQMESMRGGVVYVTHGIDDKLISVHDVARNNRIFTFSTGFECVESQKCVMGMTADPVKIEISRTVTADSQFEFSQALKLMIKDVE